MKCKVISAKYKESYDGRNGTIYVHDIGLEVDGKTGVKEYHTLKKDQDYFKPGTEVEFVPNGNKIKKPPSDFRGASGGRGKSSEELIQKGRIVALMTAREALSTSLQTDDDARIAKILQTANKFELYLNKGLS